MGKSEAQIPFKYQKKGVNFVTETFTILDESCMKKVLILGGSSYVGRHLVERLNKSQVIPTYNKSKIPNGIKFDSRAMNIEDVVDLDEINCSIILLGDTDPESCTDDIKRSEELNVESIKRIIDILSIKNIKIKKFILSVAYNT